MKKLLLTILLLCTFTVPSAMQCAGDAFVAKAGRKDAQGLYTCRGMQSGKPYFNLVGHPDNTDAFSIVWSNGAWYIDDFQTDVLYFAYEDVPYPWMVTQWQPHPWHGIPPMPVVILAVNNNK